MRTLLPLLIVLLVAGCEKPTPISLVPVGFDPTTAFPAQESGTRPPVLVDTLKPTQQELDEGNVLLFDGVSTYGWKILEGHARPAVVRDMQSGGNLLTVLDEKEQVVQAVVVHPQGNGKITFKENGTINVGGVGKGFFAVHYDFGTSDIGLKSVSAKPMDAKPLLEADWRSSTGAPSGETKAAWSDGVLELTGGPGMVETMKEYGDFVLQLEYFTEPGVNSGVFFRCVLGETLNGYECQIFNNPPAGDYEKFIGTDTGGIFRRCVGRNVGPKDGEWNYLTIAARGPMIATWVNGIQTVDWTDTRKEDDNPRKGLRLKPGTIQLQGHDPGTKIKFRNVRIAEME